MCDQIKKIEEYMQDYSEHLRLIREGSIDNLERAGQFREALEEYVSESIPENNLKNQKEINLKA